MKYLKDVVFRGYNVRIVATYRPFHDWILSEFNEENKGRSSTSLSGSFFVPWFDACLMYNNEYVAPTRSNDNVTAAQLETDLRTQQMVRQARRRMEHEKELKMSQTQTELVDFLTVRMWRAYAT